MSDIKVTGHTPADTDSVCSPIAYAWYSTNVLSQPAVAVVGSDLNKETICVLEKLKVAHPTKISEFDEGEKLVLVDTTNPKELIPGTQTAEIVTIIDHHKLGGLTTEKPTNATIRTYGCTATVIWEMMGEKVAQLPPEIAGVMAAAIISDTLKLSSPTTTEMDRQALASLAKQASLDIDSFAAEMFAAKSDISDMSAKQVLETDYKDFDFGGKNYRICSIETTKPEFTLNRIAEFRSEVEQVKTSQNLAGVFVFVVDIIAGQATMFCTNGAEDFAEKAFGVKFEAGLMQLPGVVSRKKQIVPAFEKAA